MMGREGREGQRFGNYRLLHLLGRGGFAEVYLGEHVFLETQAAIKVLKVQLEPGILKDFLHEARTLARLEHPHIVRVLDFGLQDATPFLVMHYAPHGSLRQRHPKGSILPLDSIVAYIKEIAAALQHAHEQKLIHRDVKPENMLLGRDGNLLLSDFGVSVFARRSQQARFQEVSGTVTYMAPEQLRGEPCPASDQYALGIVVYEWLTGSCPFQGTFAEVAQQHFSAAPASLRERIPTILPAVEQVVLMTLTKEPRQRFASVQDFAAALEEAFQPGIVSISSAPAPSSKEQELPVVSIAAPAPPTWNVPFRRNPFFTGREDILLSLHELLRGENEARLPSLPQAISGLGGMGKTQTAIEYAYRYRSEYQAVLWAKADSYETLLADFINIARLLKLPGQDEHDPRRACESVRSWLEEHTGWLLVLDNVEDLPMVDEFLPSTIHGHVLLTTRAQAMANLAHNVELEKMEADEGALFLLRRAKIIEQNADLEDTTGADYIEARDIAMVMDGLPLALDQAGAYIEETACSLSDYLDRYRRQSSALLELRGAYISEHPEPVSTTWLLSFQKVEQSNPAAAELLRLCAFLHPDGIHEEIIDAAATELGALLQPIASEPYRLDTAIAALRKFSLVRRHPESNTFSIHRLVQAVLKDSMPEEVQRQWAERAVRAINRAFPAGDQVATWPRCQLCLPHAQACVLLIEQWHMLFPEAARLLSEAGMYLLEHAQFSRSESMLKKALDLRVQILGPEDPEVADSLNNLAGPYLYQGKYAEAEPLLKKALEIQERAQGLEHPALSESLNNLALLYNYQGKYAQAEPLFLRAVAIWEHVPDRSAADSDCLARTLNNLALLYQVQGKYRQAEPLYERSLAIWERMRGPEHPDVAVSLNNLALLYQSLGKESQAASIFQRVLNIREKTLGPEHPSVAHSLSYLAKLYQRQHRYTEAEVLFKQALTIRKRSLGPEHPEVANTLNDMAGLYATQGNHTAAESLFQEALSIRERVLGPHHPDVAVVLKNYALLLSSMKRKDEAVKLTARAKAIQSRLVSPSLDPT